jgi:hypothetical protein
MTRIAIISSTALATLLGAALPAMAQAPVPAPMYAPAPPPMMAPAPAPMPMAEIPALPPPAVAAPRAADDMTGSVGFGVAITSGTDLIKPDTTTVAMKYYMSDSLAIMPSLAVAIGKAKGQDAEWALSPGAVAMFNLLKGASTRFDAGVGLAFLAQKLRDPETNALPADATIGIIIPAALNVEHFFTRWFSMGLGAQMNLLQFLKTGEAWEMRVELSNIRYMGSLFFYTD